VNPFTDMTTGTACAGVGLSLLANGPIEVGILVSVKLAASTQVVPSTE
jgi:hypothetical protein